MALTLCLSVTGIVCCCRYCKNRENIINLPEIFKRTNQKNDGIVQKQPTYKTFPDTDLGKSSNGTSGKDIECQESSYTKQQVVCELQEIIKHVPETSDSNVPTYKTLSDTELGKSYSGTSEVPEHGCEKSSYTKQEVVCEVPEIVQ